MSEPPSPLSIPQSPQSVSSVGSPGSSTSGSDNPRPGVIRANTDFISRLGNLEIINESNQITQTVKTEPGNFEPSIRKPTFQMITTIPQVQYQAPSSPRPKSKSRPKRLLTNQCEPKFHTLKMKKDGALFPTMKKTKDLATRFVVCIWNFKTYFIYLWRNNESNF